MDVLLGVLATLVATYLLIALSPWGERLRFWSVSRFGTDGIAIHVEVDPTNIASLGDDDITRLLFAQDFHVEGLDPGALPPAPPVTAGPTALWSWGHALGGADVIRTTVLVTLQALADTAVVVDPPRITHQWTPCTSGITLGSAGWGRGGGIVPRRYDIRLNEESADVRYDDDLDRPPSFTLAQHDSERLLIVVDVGPGRYDWSIELPVTADGRRTVHHIDDHGRPFTTFGWLTGRTFVWWGNEGWQERSTSGV